MSFAFSRPARNRASNDSIVLVANGYLAFSSDTSFVTSWSVFATAAVLVVSRSAAPRTAICRSSHARFITITLWPSSVPRMLLPIRRLAN